MSALDSLATYTDSDEEDVAPEEESGLSSQQASAPGSPATAEPSKETFDHQLPPPAVTQEVAKRLSGLVTYQDVDDQIDDDAVDDYQSDSLSEKDDEMKIKSGKVSEDDSKSPHVVPQQEVPMDTEISESEANGKIKLPPEPLGKPNDELQERVTRLYKIKITQGLDMNVHIQRNKQFRNPSIYEKLIKHCNIDELGTNYPSDIYNPHEWTESSFYDELAKIQKNDIERREKEKKERTKVEFISGTAVKKPHTSSAPVSALPVGLSAAALEAEKRKSKWDQRASAGSLHHFAPGQPSLMQPNIATAVTGTKSTVINAFGNLPKKAKQ